MSESVCSSTSLADVRSSSAALALACLDNAVGCFSNSLWAFEAECVSMQDVALGTASRKRATAIQAGRQATSHMCDGLNVYNGVTWCDLV